MSYRRGSSTTYYKVSCGDLVPAGVVIGRQGSTIKAMQQISGAQIRIRDNEVQVRGSQKQVATSKGLLSELKNNYSRGVIGLTSTVRPKRVQKKIRVRTNTSTGWSTVESNQTEESAAAKPEPKKVTFASTNHFNGLDFGSDSEESDEEVSSAAAAPSSKPVEEFPALPSGPQIRLVIKEKKVPQSKWSAWIEEKQCAKASRTGMSWADMCDEDDDDE